MHTEKTLLIADRVTHYRFQHSGTLRRETENSWRLELLYFPTSSATFLYKKKETTNKPPSEKKQKPKKHWNKHDLPVPSTCTSCQWAILKHCDQDRDVFKKKTIVSFSYSFCHLNLSLSFSNRGMQQEVWTVENNVYN